MNVEFTRLEEDPQMKRNLPEKTVKGLCSRKNDMNHTLQVI